MWKHRFAVTLAVFHLTLLVSYCSSQVITTIAGGALTFQGAGGPATSASLGAVRGVAVDSAGNLFATDFTHLLVVKISPNGILAVAAGNGIRGYSGDGGPAASASLNRPDSVAVDASGNFYIADELNSYIRRVSPDGTITTVAGNGLQAFSGDGGAATKASLNRPHGVVMDAAGNLYIADWANNRIRRVTPGGIITTLAGNGVQGFSGDGGPAANASLMLPNSVAVDAAGNLLIADTYNHRIRKVTPGGIITTAAGNGTCCFSGDGGPAFSASLNAPSGVAVDVAGNLFIADTGNYRIRKVTATGIINTIAGTGTVGFSGDGGPALGASFANPIGVALDAAGNLYVADSDNDRVRKVATTGIISTVAGGGVNLGDGGPAVSASFNQPIGIALDGSGNLYVADSVNWRVRKVSPTGIITTVAGNGIVGSSGDGGPATSASLGFITGVALDVAGNLYIADPNNFRIRKVNPNGIIITVAGNGAGGFSGDSGPATSAMLNRPPSVVADTVGNLYIADQNNNRIRKVSAAGIISTVAGNGVAGFFGDGSSAISASLNRPCCVAVDTSGNLYIADQGNLRIRKVSPSGLITTMAGNGIVGSSGEGGPASSASFSLPNGLAVDGSGSVYIADAGNGRILRISPDGTLTRVAGKGVQGFSGDGGLATQASLAAPSGVLADPSANIYIADSFNDRVRKVLTSAPSFSVSPVNLSFSAPAGGPAVSAQQVSITSSVPGLQWRADASTQGGGAWLSFSPANGTAPGILAVSVDASNLSPGTYSGTVTILAPLAVPATQTVAVQLTVLTSLAPQLTVEPASLTFQSPVAVNPAAQSLRIRNAGSGVLNWTAAAATISGGNWLSVSPASGSASSTSSSTVQVLANVGNLGAGVYSGSVQVSSPATSQTQTVAVTLLLIQSTQTILVSQSGLLFTAVEGGGSVPSQSFGVLNTGQGTMSWTVQASSASGGNWLSVSPSSGSTPANSLQIPLVDVAVNTAGLRAGQYSGLLRVVAPGANNSPQFVSVFFNVLSAGSNPGVLVRPTGLIFAAQAGTSSPGSQTVRAATVTPGNVQYLSGLLTFGGDWLDAAPRNAVLFPSSPQTIVVQPALGSLAPGVYRGTLTLAFSDGSPAQVVNILFLVLSPAAGAAAFRHGGPAVGCAPQRLYALQRALGSSFVSPAGWPSSIEVQVVDDCGNAIPNATVVTSFSNGDPPLALASLQNGLYTGTWRPVNPASQITVTVRADLPPLATAEAQLQGQVTSNPAAPALFAGGIVNAASFAPGQALAPGGIVSVFGRNLASGKAGATILPLPTTLGGATLSVGGVDVPLFFSSDGQINAQLPFELAPNSRQHAVVKAPAAITVPETITVAPAQPGIFATNQQGTGQGAILNLQGQLVDSTAPTAAGGIVQVFATGLGTTNPPVASGRPGPNAEPLARVTGAVTATVGGQPAIVQFAGLAPGFVGLYQVNVQVPAGLTAGPDVPLVLLLNGVPSNTVNVAVH